MIILIQIIFIVKFFLIVKIFYSFLLAIRYTVSNPLHATTHPDQVAKLLGPATPFRFSCTGCGNCCRSEGSVYFTAQDLANIYTHLQLKSAARRALT